MDAVAEGERELYSVGGNKLSRKVARVFKQENFASVEVVTYDEDPFIVALALGIPGTLKRKGESVAGRPQLSYSYNAWSLDSRLNKECDISDHLRDLFEQLDGNHQKLRELGQRFSDSVFYIASYSELSTPIIDITPEVIGLIAESGLGLTFDLYVSALDFANPPSGGQYRSSAFPRKVPD